MVDQCTMAELRRAPTEGYAEAIVVLPILAEQIELKQSLINTMTSDQFFRLEKDNPHDHIRWFNKITSTIKYKDVPNSAIKLMLFPFSLVGDRYKELLRACPHHVFTELHQLDTFYNALNPTDQNSLNFAAGGNLLERRTQDVLTIIENKYKCHATGGNTFPKLKDNIQGYVAAAAVNYNQEEDERVEETLTDQDLAEYTIKKMLKALLSNKEKLLELANTPFNENYSAVIIKKLPEKLGDFGKFLTPCSFKMILRDGDEILILNMRHDTSSYSNQPQKESINIINIYDDSCKDFLKDLFATNHQSGNPTFSSHPKLTSPKVKDDIFDPEGGNVLIEKLLDLDSTKDLHPHHNVNPLSGRITFSSPNQLLEEFADELALITFPLGNDDLSFDIESDHKEIEYLLNNNPIKEMDSILEDSVDEDNLADLNKNLFDTMPEMFTDEHALDYSSLSLYDKYDDDLFTVKSDTKYVYNDPFDSKGEKIREFKLLTDELDLPRSSDFLPSPKYDSFLLEDFFEVNALPSTNNEDKNVKKIAISHASLILKDFDPPLYEHPFFKEVLGSETLLSFSSKNEEKVFKPKILTSKGVYFSLIPELSHRGYKVFKIIKILKSSMEIFLFSYGENICILDVPCLHFYPSCTNQFKELGQAKRP
uniref:Reverse transcriptase domain-containing protein n=1 Tax=Tanacetum cinerariifolium TaxID=118510 RepID=A0A6L2L604_TANCI|nr:reverse transcriptase domain-containing protein [Tanacetum cinerariifolium]